MGEYLSTGKSKSLKKQICKAADEQPSANLQKLVLKISRLDASLG